MTAEKRDELSAVASPARDPLLTRLAQSGLLRANASIGVAVSGGLDSVALLDLLVRLQQELALNLCVIHVHHGLRGQSADRDAEYVRELAHGYDLTMHIMRKEAGALSRARDISVEHAAREVRYEAFSELANELSLDLIATAHTADDQAETILFRILRGTGIHGLKGIPKQRGIYIRPLLGTTRAELFTYVRERDLSFCEDETNADLSYSRNRIRHELMPYLRAHFNPAVSVVVNRLGEIATEQETVNKELAEKAFNSLVSLQKKNQIVLEIRPFLNYFKFIQKYVLIRACSQLGVERRALNSRVLKRAVELIHHAAPGRFVKITQDVHLMRDYDSIVISRNERGGPTEVSFTFQDTGSVTFQDYLLSWSFLPQESTVCFDNSREVEFVDLERLGFSATLRTPRPGDRFTPLNFHGQKKISDYFTDHKVPHFDRRKLPLLCTSSGIAWLCGLCIDDSVKVTEKTRRVLRLQISECVDG